MQPAKRLEKIPPYLFVEITNSKREAIRRGVDLIDLGIGDPDQPTPKHIIDKLYQAAQNPENHRYDESDYGNIEFREAVAHWYKRRFGVDLDSNNEVLTLIGSKEGIGHIVWAWVDYGDTALIPEPCYPVYKMSTLLAGGEPYIMPLLEGSQFLPDLEQIPGEVAKKARLMFLNYPNNPTAAVADLVFFRKAVEFAKSYNILICHDCAYSEIAFDGYKAPSILQVDAAKDVAIEFHSLSKTYNMTGWRIGFAVGNPQVLAALSKIKTNIDSGVFMAIQQAGIEALTGPQDCVDKMRQVYQRRRDIIIEGLNSLGWQLEPPKATFYVWVPVPKAYNSTEFATLLLKQAGIIVVPGVGYGEHGEGYIRLALTIKGERQEERLKEAIERIKQKIKFKWG